ncbi:MAG: glutathione S-transferase family protein [Alphaproteobacteria bacterium]|nr:glutathione S-transferase family protein [Alphaproteobacteria bacterium]
MALTIYGIPTSRALRILWLANELGLDFKYVPVDFSGGSRQPEFMKLNPNGHVPVIDDDGLILWESLACNLYLIKKHGGPLLPKNLADEGRALQWSFWVMTEVEKAALSLLRKLVYPADIADAEVAAARGKLVPAFSVLNGALMGKDCLLGTEFTIADLNVAAVLAWLKIVKYDFSAIPNVEAWLTRCLARPAYVAAKATK